MSDDYIVRYRRRRPILDDPSRRVMLRYSEASSSSRDRARSFGVPQDEGLLQLGRSVCYLSNRNPHLIVTCHSVTVPSSIAPRVSSTSNQRMLRTVFPARVTAFCTASSHD